MIEQEKKQQIRQKVVFLVMLAVGCLGAGIFSVSRGMSAYQNKEKFVRVDTEEKFYRLPQYLLSDLALLKDTDPYVRYHAAEVLGGLQAQEAIPQLMPLPKDADLDVHFRAIHALGALRELQAKGSIPLMLWLKDADSDVRSSTVQSVSKKHPNHNLDRASGAIVIRQNLYQELIVLGGISLATLVLLLLKLLHSQQVKGITFSVNLKSYFSDDIVAELAALRERLTKENKSTWRIRISLFYQILTLVWGIYIQINIDNLTLPSRDRRIDK